MDDMQKGQSGRDAVLKDLMALDCDVLNGDAFAQFVAVRATILQRLDAIKEPWTQAQKAALHQALAHGAALLNEAQRHRQNMAKKIDSMRAARRAHKDYGNTLPARFKKQF